MNGFGLVILFFALIYIAKSSEWYRKAKAYGNQKIDPNYVPNYEEIIRAKEFDLYKRKVDYLFISLCSFFNWMIEKLIRRYQQIKAFVKI